MLHAGDIRIFENLAIIDIPVADRYEPRFDHARAQLRYGRQALQARHILHVPEREATGMLLEERNRILARDRRPTDVELKDDELGIGLFEEKRVGKLVGLLAGYELDRVVVDEQFDPELPRDLSIRVVARRFLLHVVNGPCLRGRLDELLTHLALCGGTRGRRRSAAWAIRPAARRTRLTQLRVL